MNKAQEALEWAATSAWINANPLPSRDDMTGLAFNYRNTHKDVTGSVNFLSTDEFREILKLIDARRLVDLYPAGGLNQPPAPQNVVFLFHNIAGDGYVLRKYTQRSYPDNLDGLRCMGTFDANLAAVMCDDVDVLQPGNGSQAGQFQHPGLTLTAKGFEGNHHAGKDALVTALNCTAIAVRHEIGMKGTGGQSRRDETSERWFVPPVIRPIKDLPTNLMLVSIDCEHGNYHSRLNGSQYKKHEPLMQIGFAVLDLKDVHNVPPGVNCRGWHRYWKVTTMYRNKVEDFLSTSLIQKRLPSVDMLGCSHKIIACESKEAMTREISIFFSHLANKNVIQSPVSLIQPPASGLNRPLAPSVSIIQSSAPKIPPFELPESSSTTPSSSFQLPASSSKLLPSSQQKAQASFDESVRHLPTMLTGLAGGLNSPPASRSPPPAPGNLVELHRKYPFDESKGTCEACHGMAFSTEDQHMNYIFKLRSTCADNLNHAWRCQTFLQCEKRNFICPKFNSKSGCDKKNAVSHFYDMHRCRHCTAKQGEGECGKSYNNQPERPCFVHMVVWHIKRTCKHGKDCKDSKCKYGHDHMDVRRLVAMDRELEAENNLEIAELRAGTSQKAPWTGPRW